MGSQRVGHDRATSLSLSLSLSVSSVQFSRSVVSDSFENRLKKQGDLRRLKVIVRDAGLDWIREQQRR